MNSNWNMVQPAKNEWAALAKAPDPFKPSKPFRSGYTPKGNSTNTRYKPTSGGGGGGNRRMQT